MAKGFKHGAGGTSLNFKVISNPKPETATENTIWVDTDAKINGWDFSPVEPAQPREGMIWFASGTSGNAALNALKKNGIQVYLISAKQYVNGAWVYKIAKIYQGGEWIQFSAARYYLFKSGEGALVRIKTYRETNATVSITTDSISTAASSDGDCYASIRTESKINLSGYSKMCITYTADTPQWGGNNIFVTSTAFTKGDIAGISFAAKTAIGEATSATTAIVDISNISESLYCGFYYCGTLSVTEWWLE